MNFLAPCAWSIGTWVLPTWAIGAALLVVSLDGQPVRFGAPLPAAAVASGLRLEGRGQLQWRRLPVGGPDADPVWVELAICGPPGTVRVCAGGSGPHDAARGPVLARETAERALPWGTERTLSWRWHDGTIDTVTRTVFTAPTVLDGEAFASGEARTVGSEVLSRRAIPVCRLPRPVLVAAGVLPPTGGGGETTKTLRGRLTEIVPRLAELPGVRGAGDYGRSGGVVTNLEYDTTLALARCAVGLGDANALARARRALEHLFDRDIDPRTGLPFPHGPDHRTGVPEPGHVWLQGPLLIALLTADDDALLAVRNVARALAASPPSGEKLQERLRDYAWPLRELEALLAAAPDTIGGARDDRLAASIDRRYDPAVRTFRFGEGEVAPGIYFERGWLTGGLLLPALRAHLARRPSRTLAEHVAATEAMLLERIASPGQGLPTHWRCANGAVFAEHREQDTAAAAFLLDALAPRELKRLLRRGTVRGAVDDLPHFDDPDLATEFSLVARCDWPWR